MIQKWIENIDPSTRKKTLEILIEVLQQIGARNIKKFYLSLHCTWVLPGTNWAILYQLLRPKRVAATLKRLSSLILHFPTFCLAGSKVFFHLILENKMDIQYVNFHILALHSNPVRPAKDHKTIKLQVANYGIDESDNHRME